MAAINLHFRVTAVIIRFQLEKNETKKLLVLHPGIFSNMVVKRQIKPEVHLLYKAVSCHSKLTLCIGLLVMVSVVFLEPYTFLMKVSFFE